MKVRVIEHTRESTGKKWYTAEYRRFFIWLKVPGFVEGMIYDITFSTELEAWQYIDWYFKDETITKKILY